MSVDPDPAQLSPPRDPAEYAPPKLMGLGFWVLIAFGVLCVAAGAGVTAFGPTLFPPKAKPAALETQVAPRPEAPQPLAQALAESTSPPPASASSSAELAALNARIESLETTQSRAAESAAAALAAAALLEAAQTSRPFSDELSALEAVAPASADLRSLRSLASAGAPSRAALAVEFPDYAARAAAAARAAGDGAGLWARIQATLSRVVMVRQVGEVRGKGVDALLARAERQLNDGDVDHALVTLGGLSPAGREAIEPWLARARVRAEIDRRVSAVRARALEDLARLSRGGA